MSDNEAEIAGKFGDSYNLVGHDWNSYEKGVEEAPNELHLVVHSVGTRLEQAVSGQNTIVWTCGEGGDLTTVGEVGAIIDSWK